jgi:hypothetical protein
MACHRARTKIRGLEGVRAVEQVDSGPMEVSLTGRETDRIDPLPPASTALLEDTLTLWNVLLYKFRKLASEVRPDRVRVRG